MFSSKTPVPVFRGAQDVHPLDQFHQGWVNRNMMWYIDGWSNNCERLHVFDSDGETLHLSKPLKMDHSANANIICIPAPRIGPTLYGAYLGADEGRQIPSDWRPMQRMILEHPGLRWYMGFGWVGACFDQPLFVIDQTYIKYGYFGPPTYAWNPANTQTGIPNDHPSGYSADVKSAGSYTEFDAFADNTIVLHGGPDLRVGFPIVLDNPYFETLPGGITSGRHYLVKAWNPATKTARLSEIGTPGTELDLTSAGRGHIFYDFDKGVEVGFDRCELRGGGVGIDSLQLHAKPGAYTKDCRSYYGTLSFKGKGSSHRNMDCQHTLADSSFPNEPVIWWEGEGHYSDYCNSNGGAIAHRVGNVRGLFIEQLYCEGMDKYGIQIVGAARGFMTKQRLNNRAANISNLIDMTGAVSSYDMGPVDLQLTNHPVDIIDNMPPTLTQQGDLWDYHEGDRRYALAGVIKTPYGVIIKNRLGAVYMHSSGSENAFHRLGRGQIGAIFTRSDGSCWMPDCTGLVPGTMFWLYKGSNPPPYPGGTITVYDHLGNVLDTLSTYGVLKFYRWSPNSDTYSPSWWRITSS